jgi:hypothetical protein
MKKPILLSLFSAAVAFTSYAQAEEKNKPATEQAAVNVADTLKGKLQILDGDKYTPAKVDPKVSHYVVYYTASW